MAMLEKVCKFADNDSRNNPAVVMTRLSPCHTYFLRKQAVFPTELESGKFKLNDIEGTRVLYAYTACKPIRNQCDISVASVSRCQAFTGALVHDTFSHTFLCTRISGIYI